MRHCFLDRLVDYDCHIIAGNHDVYHKNTNGVNALTEMVDKYPTIKVYTEPTVSHILGKPSLFLPWINTENEEHAMELIENVRMDFCFSHLQLQGFEMYTGSFAEHGLDSSLFSKFSAVYSGHFHHKSTRNNIHYLGAPYEITWSDYNDFRGFHILDSDTGELEFIQNPFTMFHKVIYNDSNTNLTALLDQDYSIYHKKYVKLIITRKENPYWFERVMEEIEKANPFDLQIVEDHLQLGLENNPDLLEEAQDTFTILKSYVNGISGEVDKSRLENLLKTLYDEASAISS